MPPDNNSTPAPLAQQAYYMLQELKRLNECSAEHDRKFDAHKETMATKLASLQAEVAALKVKSGVWGFAAGAIPVVLMLLVQFLIR